MDSNQKLNEQEKVNASTSVRQFTGYSYQRRLLLSGMEHMPIATVKAPSRPRDQSLEREVACY